METEKKISRNSEIFRDVLEGKGLTYADVYRILNCAGITKYNYILDKDGNFIEQENEKYLGKRSFHSADDGARTPFECTVDCVVGNIQEDLFCLDNRDFTPNSEATNINVKLDSGITTGKLDLIHKPTGVEVELKTSRCKEINEEYNTVIYRHRDAKFAEYLRKGHIMIVDFPYLKKVAVFDYRNFKDKEMGITKGSVKVIKPDYVDNCGKHWDIVSIWSGLLIDYDMMKNGNYKISEKVSEIVKKREIK